nr:MAG TPA: tail protein [Caudoviricetes sp.]
MIKKRVNKINWHGSDLENNRAKAPNISTPGGNGLDGLNDGEIYVCNADEDPAIFIKTNKDKVARVGGNGSDSYPRDQIDDFLRKKLDKVVWDRNLEERVDDNGEEYLFLTKPLITAYGVTMYAGADVQVPSIYEGLPIDGVTIQWVDGKLVATGGKGTANGIVVNGNTYTPNEDGIITLPNYPSLSGYATEQWVNNTLSGYATSSSLSQLSAKVDNFLEGTDTDGIINKWKELESFLAGQTQTSTLAELLSVKADKATTLAGYGITDAYTKNDISGLLADYVTKSGAQDITGIKSFINGLNIGDILVKKHSDGVVELDGDLILTGSLTMFAQGSHTASTILDALPIDNTTLSKEGGVLSVIGGVGGGSVDGIILNGTTYSPDETTKLITLPNYPTTLPASDVYSWAKQPNKPSYSFGELSSHPTTLSGYGITDAYTKSDADSRYFRQFGDTYEDGGNTGWIGLGTGTYINAYPDGIAHKIYSYGQVTSFYSSYSRLELYSTHTSSDPNDGNNGIQFRSGWNDDKKSWRMLLDEVNYLHYTDNRYVNKAGDAMTGNLVFAHTSERPSYSGSIGITFREQIANGQGVKLVYNDFDNYRAPAGLILVGEQGGEYFEAPAIYQNGYKVWDAGNKRDMFSSMNEVFTTWGNEQVINVEGDANTYYPVVITIDRTKTWNSRISIYKNLGSRTPSYPGNHSDGTSSMWAMYEGRYHGWDGNSGYIVTKYVRQPYANLISKAEHADKSVGALVVYLRGGGCEYRVCTDYRGGVNVYYERTEISGYSNYPVYVEPTTSVGNQGVLNTTGYDYLVQKAVRLETPRTIFSKPFDGTNNVTGGAKFNGICIETDNNGNDSGRINEINNYNEHLYLQYNSPNNLICCMGGGNVGIGTPSPSYKLHVTGSLMCEGEWIRNTGDYGWYNATHGGGIYMEDSTWVKVYNNKHFQCKGTIFGYRYTTNNNAAAFSFDKPGSYMAGIGSGGSDSLVRLGPCDSTGEWYDWGGQTWQLYGNFLTTGGITMYSDLRKKNVLNSIIVPLDVMANADLFDYTFKTDEKCKVRAGTSAQYWNVFLPQVTDTDNEGFFTMSYDVLATTCVLSMAKHFQRFLIEDFGRHETEIERLKRENEELKNRVSELERRAA